MYDRENKELKGKQAKQSVDSVKSVVADKAIKNRAERDRCVNKSIDEYLSYLIALHAN